MVFVSFRLPSVRILGVLFAFGVTKCFHLDLQEQIRDPKYKILISVALSMVRCLDISQSNNYPKLKFYIQGPHPVQILCRSLSVLQLYFPTSFGWNPKYADLCNTLYREHLLDLEFTLHQARNLLLAENIQCTGQVNIR